MHFPGEWVLGFPQLLTEVPDPQRVWIGATYHPPELPCPISLPGVPKLLSPASSMQPLGPEAKGLLCRSAAPTLEGSRWFPQLLAPRCPLSSAPVPQWAPCGLTSMGATLLLASAVMFHPPSSPLCVSTPVGSVGLWRWGVKACLVECKRAVAQRAVAAPSFLMVGPGSALVSHHLWDSALFWFCFSSS